MEKNLNLIVMLTYNDKTVSNATEIFRKYKDSKAVFWGFKEKDLPLEEMKKLYEEMKKNGKITFLEVVGYTEKEGIEGAKVAKECKCDILMGTKYFDSINNYCKENKIKYMPFVGKLSKRPTILEGEIDEIIKEAKEYEKKGVFGFDLLGYRYTGNVEELNKKFVLEIKKPVCIAGSINSYCRLDEIKSIKPWAFTIGGAFFENKFDGNIGEQINKVIEYIEK